MNNAISFLRFVSFLTGTITAKAVVEEQAGQQEAVSLEKSKWVDLRLRKLELDFSGLAQECRIIITRIDDWRC